VTSAWPTDLWLLYREQTSPESGDLSEETLSEDTAEVVLLGDRNFERIQSDAGLEWLFCLVSALQAAQQMLAPSNLSSQKNAKPAP
jgi:hypothetical protein